MSGGNPFAPPRVDFYGMLSGLGQSLQAAQQRGVTTEIGQQLAAAPSDPAAYERAAALAFQGGDFDKALQLQKVGLQYKQQAASEKASGEFSGMFNGATPAAAPTPAATSDRSVPSMVGMDPTIAPIAAAIRQKESGGRYDVVGPTHPKYGRALGAYQVMEANLPQWSQEALGREVTPQEFLANPKLQDAIANHRMGMQYAQYGNPADVASVWHSGQPLARAGGRQDVLGTKTTDYARDIASQVGSADAPAPGAQATQFQIPGQAPAPATDGSVLDKVPLPQLMRMATNPNLPKQQQQVAEMLLKRKLDMEPGDSLMSDAEKAQNPTLAAYPGPVLKKQNGGIQLLGEQFYGPQSAAKIAATASGKEAEAKATSNVKYFEGLREEGSAASGRQVDVETLRGLSRNLGNQGAAAQVKEALGPYAQALGVNINGLGDIQAYSSIINKLTPNMRPPGSGATSNYEEKLYKSALPGLLQVPETRELVMDMMATTNQNAAAKGQIAQDYLGGFMTHADAQKQLKALPSPLDTFKEFRSQNPQVFQRAFEMRNNTGVPLPGDAPKAPQVGQMVDGYRFKGGNPSDKASWVKAQ